MDHCTGRTSHEPRSPADPTPPLPPASVAGASDRGVITGPLTAIPEYKPHDDQRPKLSHLREEVESTQIAVVKKATVIKLDQEPTIIGNHWKRLPRTPDAREISLFTPAHCGDARTRLPPMRCP